VTPSISETGYFEIQFMQANNFWNCPFNFGNANTGSFPNCGTEIRQGISHLVDKVSFSNSQPNLAGISSPIDNPLPVNNGGLPTPNPCAWDASFPGSANCNVGAPGGAAYHLAAATFNNGFAFNQPGITSPDMCAAAAHFIKAGLATGTVGYGLGAPSASQCATGGSSAVLTGIASTVTAHTVNFFIRIDNAPRFQLGQSVAQEICALFGQGFVQPCAPYLTVTPGPITAFPGFITSPTSVNLSWHIYTAGYGQVFPFDSSLYFIYNSRFVSGIPTIKQSGGGFCRNDSVGTFSAGNYMYLCSPTYDQVSTAMETAACLSATGDPANGQSNPTFANCAGGSVTGLCSPSTNCTAISAGYQSENFYGANAFTVPIYVQKDQFGYLAGSSNWQRVINSAGSGVPTFFTWLSAWSASPTQSGTIRQGFKQNIKSVSPFIESTVWDAYVFGNVFDSIGASNPLNNAQLLNWMGVSLQTINPANTGSLGYTPPTGTSAALRISLRSDNFWQNDNSGSHPAKQVTAYDVAFSYLSLLGSGAFNSGGASPTTGITVINQSTFDFDLSALGPFTQLFELGLPIIPGQYWSGAGQSTWNTSVDNTVFTCSHQPTASAVVGCFRAQYTLDPVNKIGTSTIPAVDCADSTVLSGASGCSHIPGSLLNVDTSKVTATYDPVANGILIGSGPWEAVTSGVVGGGTGVTPCGQMVCSTSPSYTLQRYGSVSSITASGCGVSDHYFRSNCTLAIWGWSGDNGDFTHDFSSELQVVRACNAVSPVPAQCVHWTKGIAGTGGSPITSVQIGAVNRFVAVNWVGGAGSSFNWNTNPPTGIAAFPPVLYDGPTTTLNPCSIDPTNGYDC